MFTGLVQEIGKIKKVSKNKDGMKIEVFCPKIISEIKVDDSISINGVCQTAVTIKKDSFICDAIQTTLQKTTFNELKAGVDVNLELALKLGDRLGGHLVQGHVNEVTSILKINKLEKSYVVILKLKPNIEKYITKEGSVAIDGTSLTVSNVSKTNFEVSIIPHTWENTIFKNKKIGSNVNIEVDMFAKYIQKQTEEKITMKLLTEKGFI